MSTESQQALQARTYASSEAGPLGRRLRIAGAARDGVLLKAPDLFEDAIHVTARGSLGQALHVVGEERASGNARAPVARAVTSARIGAASSLERARRAPYRRGSQERQRPYGILASKCSYSWHGSGRLKKRF